MQTIQRKKYEKIEIRPKYITDYKKFSQHLIKKGKKYTVENIFKAGILHWMKHMDSLEFEDVLKKAFVCVKPGVGLKTKRKGSKNIYIPYRLTTRRSEYLSANWMLTSALARNKRKLSEKIIEELVETSLKKSSSNKKYEEMFKLAEESLINVR